MTLLQPATTGAGFLKAGFLGFNKSGKTYTATELAIFTRQMFNLEGPIAFFDTEGGAVYVRGRVKEATGQDMLVLKSRALGDLQAVAKECVEIGVSVLIADSMTHVWREVCDTFLNRLNAARERRNRSKLDRLEFQHWAAVKGEWAVWTDLYLNLPLHIIICGRAGFEWDFETDEDTGRKNLLKTGIKMKTEGEFGFEPSLLVQMEREQVMGDHGAKSFTHRATVLGDRFGVMDAKVCDNPAGSWFEPHLAMLTPGDVNTIDTSRETDIEPNVEGNVEWQQEKRERTIILEEIKAAFIRQDLDGTKAAVKKLRVAAMQFCWGTTSWTAMERMKSQKLREGLSLVAGWVAEHAPKEDDK